MTLSIINYFGDQVNYRRPIRFCDIDHIASRSYLFIAEIELNDLLRRMRILGSGIMNSISSYCIAAK